MPKRPAPQVTPEAVYAELAKLCRYMDNLQKEAARLAGRLQPFDGESVPAGKPWIDMVPEKMPAVPSVAMTILRQVREQVYAMELHLGAVRAKLDQISNDSWSRDDMRPYLDRKKP